MRLRYVNGMIIALLCIYVGSWVCAYAAVHRFPGRMGYWALYAVAVAFVPIVFAAVLMLVYMQVDPGRAPDLARLVGVIGAAISLLAYPVSHLRLSREAGT